MEYITETEVQKIFKTIAQSNIETKGRDLAMFELMYYYGMRVSEVCLLKKKDVTADSITIQGLKNGHLQKYPILNNVAESLSAWLQIRYAMVETQSIYMFPGRSVKPITRQRISDLWNLYCELAEIVNEKRHCHALRHGIAISMLENGHDLYSVSRWLRHKDIRNTTIYLQYTARMVKATAKLLEG